MIAKWAHEKMTWKKTSYVVDGHFGSVQNGASYVDLQIFHHDQIDFTPDFPWSVDHRFLLLLMLTYKYF